MSQLFKTYEEEQEDQELFEIPDTSAALKSIEQAALQQEHVEEEEEEKKQGKKKRQPRKGVLCICGRPGCGIGPMQEIGREY